jgi:hypothetical protein
MQTVILPMTCEHCGCHVELGCEHSGTFGYMTSGWFRCPECRESNTGAVLPGAPVSIAKVQANSPSL